MVKRTRAMLRLASQVAGGASDWIAAFVCADERVVVVAVVVLKAVERVGGATVGC